MVGDTLLVECLKNCGCSPKQAAAFERWIEDTRPVGIGCHTLERAICATILTDTRKYVTAMENLSRINRDLESRVQELSGEVNRFLFVD